MSDDGEKPKAAPDALTLAIPKRQRPKTQKLGEDPALDAAVRAYTASDDELGVKDKPSVPPVQDLTRGRGNANAYVARVELKSAKVPAAKAEPKIELVMEDVPRALPEGDRTRETVETKALRLPQVDVDEATLKRALGSRTVGGGTERLPVIDKEASPWANEAGAAPVAPVELPSAHAPSATPEPASRPSGGAGRGLGKGVVLAGLLAGLALFIALRVATTDGREATGSPMPSATARATPSTTASTTPSASASAMPSMTATSAPAPEVSSAPPASTGHVPRPLKPRGHLDDDPYDAAPPPPVPTQTAAPAVTATAPPTAQPTAAPKATATGDGEFFNLKPKTP
jgi:hypothetical protein